jgi:hypothetical protein
MQIIPIASYIKYLVEECYEEDYNPQYAEFWYDNYCYEYSFYEWYFLYRIRFNLKKDIINNYKFTHKKLIIGTDIYDIKKI